MFEACAEEESRLRLLARNEMLQLWTNEYVERLNCAAARFQQALPKNREQLQVGDKVYIVKQIITRKFDHKSEPYRLVEQLGKSLWKAESQDEPSRMIKVHSRHLRKAGEVEGESSRQEVQDETPELPKQQLEEMSGTAAPVPTDNAGRPPETTNDRTTSESRFLSSIQGKISRTGRIRRGSYVQ